MHFSDKPKRSLESLDKTFSLTQVSVDTIAENKLHLNITLEQIQRFCFLFPLSQCED